MTPEPYRMPSSSDFDPAETETAARNRVSFASTFDQLVASNLQLVKTVRTALFVVATCAVLSMTWCAFTAYSMRGTLTDMRAMLQTVLDTMKRN